MENSFVIPVKIDSNDRLANVIAVMSFLRHAFPTAPIIIAEQGTESCLKRYADKFKAVYLFTHNRKRFSKTRAINLALKSVTTTYVTIHDADILIEPDGFIQAVDKFQDPLIKAAIPYNRIAIEVLGSTKAKIIEEFRFDTLDLTKVYTQFDLKITDDLYTYSYETLGGACTFNTQFLRSIGGFNQKMISYGYEDAEIITRISKLEYTFAKVDSYNAYHLSHSRGIDSQMDDFYYKNEAEWKLVSSMTKAQVLEYIEKELK